jgi:hypothetical protein
LLLATPVDGASLAVFRIEFGAIMMLEALALVRPSLSSGGAAPLETYYTGVTFSFPYDGFEWLPLLSPGLMRWVVGLLAIGGLGMALGFAYRLSAILVFLTWGYLYALEATRTYWMSHYYLVLLGTFLMIWMPAARRYSLDARRAAPETAMIPFWPVFLLRGQLVITYFYAGLAKVNADWLLDAEPVRYFLSRPHVTTPFDLVNRVLRSTEFAYFISYAGALFDLAVGFLLIIRKTRVLGLVLMCLFHGTNHFLFFEDIGWFPLLGVVSALIFLPPNWPERLRSVHGRIDAPGRWSRPIPMGVVVPVCVAGWLVWQGLFPLRHLLIPGDARVTFEGLSFSWRLKAEVYRTTPCTIMVRDPALFPDTEPGNTIDWRNWEGERVIYRQVVNSDTDWAELPEILVLYEPIIGERILYNPNASTADPKSLQESMARVRELWGEMYGRAPDAVERIAPLSRIVESFAQAWIKRGGTPGMTAQSMLNLIIREHGPEGDGQMVPVLRRMYPFELVGRPALTGPFLLIEDARLLSSEPGRPSRVNRNAWKHSEATRPADGSRYVHLGGEPLLVYTVEYGIETRRLFPHASVFDVHSRPALPPFIAWDYIQDVTSSKAMHLGMQPFLLRRYARRVADLWETQHGRRPSVHALTTISLNGRPFQPVVDPEVDLAAIPVSSFGRNDWIHDLEEPRIPKDRVLPDFLGKAVTAAPPNP